MADFDKGGRTIGKRIVTMIKAVPEKDGMVYDTFLKFALGRRLRIVQIPIESDQDPIEIEYQDGKDQFQLISSKVVSDDQEGSFQFGRKEMLQLFYMQTSGVVLQEISPQEYLSSLANFSKLSARKVVARLELLQSPAFRLPSKKYFLKHFNQHSFGDIEENGHVGCGFICKHLLEDMLGGNADAKRTVCIQVRAFVPMKGIYKGMLMKKVITEGPKILFPSSMKKVESSTVKDPSTKGCLLICQAGLDPSKNNLYVGRLPTVNPNLNPPPPSFKPKELGKMMERLLKSLDVPDEIVHVYAKNCLNCDKSGTQSRHSIPQISHAFLRDVADPTNQIPPNHVFLTGFKCKDALQDPILITRSPCIKTSDGRIIKVLTTKPP